MKICGHLDDYLNDELESSARTMFERHLPECDHCRPVVDADRAIDQFVQVTKSVATVSLCRSCEEIEVNVTKTVRRQRQTRIALSLVASLLIAASLGVYRASIKQAPNSFHFIAESNDDETRRLIPDSAIEETSVLQAIVELDPNSKYLAVPMKSSNSNMTIFWLYPTVEPKTKNEPSTVNSLYSEILLAGSP